ncbi:hypothetical protein Godav_010419 [Gossypium davidsonii]|uniref:Uncharacterized protein n=1 Tax=Gossypium davidsonii TaxID=34287 RepID=A0A7J8SHA5_GOSDV|nr:hypothetical protein [Gossypium davidsonii]
MTNRPSMRKHADPEAIWVVTKDIAFEGPPRSLVIDDATVASGPRQTLRGSETFRIREVTHIDGETKRQEMITRGRIKMVWLQNNFVKLAVDSTKEKRANELSWGSVVLATLYGEMCWLVCDPNYMPWFGIHGKPYLLAEEERRRRPHTSRLRRAPLNPMGGEAGQSSVPT